MIPNLIFAAGTLAALAAPCRAAAIYHLTDLGTLGGTQSVPTGINASGEVVGTLYTKTNTESTQHAFLDANGEMIDLGTLGRRSSSAARINAAGKVAGTSLGPGNSDYEALIYSGGVVTDLGIGAVGQT